MIILVDRELQKKLINCYCAICKKGIFIPPDLMQKPSFIAPCPNCKENTSVRSIGLNWAFGSKETGQKFVLVFDISEPPFDINSII